MSCGAIRSSMEMSSATVTISLFRLSPNSSFSRASSSPMIVVMRAGFAEDVEQVGDGVDHLAVLVADLVLLEAGQAAQLQVDDRLRLLVRQVVAVVLQPVAVGQALGPVLRRAARASISADQVRRPRTRHQRALGLGGVGRLLDQLDHLVDVRERHRQAFEHVAALARLAQLVHRAARDHLAPVRDERVDQLLQVEDLAAGRRPAPPCSCGSVSCSCVIL